MNLLRRKQSVFVLITLLLTCMLTCMGAKQADIPIPESIKKQLHSEKECGVHVIQNRNVKDILKLKTDPGSAKIIVLQAMPEQVNKEHTDILNNWVNNEGGTVWFYDSRFAPALGMQPSPINPDSNLSRRVNGEYGSVKKYPGLAVIAMPYGTHPVLNGVAGAAIFIMSVGEDSYSAVRTGGDVKALLKLDLTQDIAVSAIRYAGKGKIILKPLLWPDQLDGGRFQVNLLEYSAGFPVPHITGSDSVIPDELLIEDKSMSEQQTIDLVKLSDSRTVWGKILDSEITFEGTDKGGTYTLSSIKEIELSPSGLDLLTTANNKKIKGFLILKEGFNFMTPSGKKVVLQKKDLKKVTLHVDKEAEKNGVIDTERDSK